MRKILITSALPYVNNVPHLGNIIGCVLSADVFARYCRSKEYKCIYVCGTDEYGTATQAKAIEENMTPRQICDKYHEIHKQIYEWFNISFDIFGRTSTKMHEKIVQEIFLELYKNKMLIEKEIEQPYDAKLDMFLADRYVIGECPHCGSKDARADQCDKCGKLLTFRELKDARSKLSGAKPVLKVSRHLLLNLPKAQPKLEKWIGEVEASGRWSQNTIAIAKSWLKEGLQARSITRDLRWGVPVPLKGWEQKVFYVWFDAPIGYISITAALTSDYMRWWGGEKEVEHYEFIGKDNVPFHAIIFPATLFGTGKKWTLPHYISSTEFLNYEGGKFSKSKGVGVFGNDAVESGIPADVWRYYLLSNRPESSDTAFSWDDFGKKANNELLANFGNLANRVLVFLNKNYDGIVPESKMKIEDREFCDAQRVRAQKVESLMEEVKIREAVAEFMAIAGAANTYFQLNEPWKLVKEDKERAGTVMNVLANQVLDLAILCEPFLPSTSKKIFGQLGIEPKKWGEIGRETLHVGHKISAAEHLFSPIEKKTLDKLKGKYAGKQKDEKAKEKQFLASDIELEVGLIESIERHPNAEKLYVEKVLMSDGEVRQVCSGLVPYFKEEELLGKSCVIVKNLKPANLRGITSEGMLLVAEGEGKQMEIISPKAVAGTQIGLEGIARKKKFDEILIEQFLLCKFRIKGGICYCDGKKMLVNGKEIRMEKVEEGKIS